MSSVRDQTEGLSFDFHDAAKLSEYTEVYFHTNHSAATGRNLRIMPTHVRTFEITIKQVVSGSFSKLKS